MKHVFLIFGILCLFVERAAFAQTPSDGSGLQISGAVDLVGSKNTHNSIYSGKNEVREAELLLFAPIDHLFDGTLSAAAHKEDGESVFEVHEAFISSSGLIPKVHFRAGQFFLGVGRLNQTHRHEWPFVSAPRVHREFFGEEGALDTGGEIGVLLPTDFYLDFTTGVTEGFTYGHSHTAGERPEVSTHYARLTTFAPVSETGDMQVGLNYLSRTAHDKTKMTLVGTDVTAKWKESRTLNFLLQSEIWQKSLQPDGASEQRFVGAYVYPQYGFSSRCLLGVRFDAYTITTLEDITGTKTPNMDWAAVPTLTFKASEFSTLRLAYTHQSTTLDKETTTADAVEVQATFIIGSHPSHNF